VDSAENFCRKISKSGGCKISAESAFLKLENSQEYNKTRRMQKQEFMEGIVL
jgi:hypothetical protein